MSMKGDIELFINKEDCCGCSDCLSACPMKAISMEYDEEGFMYPFIDRSICIKCQCCVRVCPIKNV